MPFETGQSIPEDIVHRYATLYCNMLTQAEASMPEITDNPDFQEIERKIDIASMAYDKSLMIKRIRDAFVGLLRAYYKNKIISKIETTQKFCEATQAQLKTPLPIETEHKALLANFQRVKTDFTSLLAETIENTTLVKSDINNCLTALETMDIAALEAAFSKINDDEQCSIDGATEIFDTLSGFSMYETSYIRFASKALLDDWEMAGGDIQVIESWRFILKKNSHDDLLDRQLLGRFLQNHAANSTEFTLWKKYYALQAEDEHTYHNTNDYYEIILQMAAIEGKKANALIRYEKIAAGYQVHLKETKNQKDHPAEDLLDSGYQSQDSRPCSGANTPGPAETTPTPTPQTDKANVVLNAGLFAKAAANPSSEIATGQPSAEATAAQLH